MASGNPVSFLSRPKPLLLCTLFWRLEPWPLSLSHVLKDTGTGLAFPHCRNARREPLSLLLARLSRSAVIWILYSTNNRPLTIGLRRTRRNALLTQDVSGPLATPGVDTKRMMAATEGTLRLLGSVMESLAWALPIRLSGQMR